MSSQIKGNRKGIWAALASALFLGLAPIFGKQAMGQDYSPFTVVAFRTILAAGLLLLLVAILKPAYLYIYPAGLLGCGLAGAINGLGSLFYYSALKLLPVSIGQLLYSLYPIFLVLWFLIDRQPSGRLTYMRIGLSLIGVVLLTYPWNNQLNWLGIVLMLIASALYALHLPINQKVLYDIPAPTVTLYTLLSMSIVTLPAYILFDFSFPTSGTFWFPVLGLTFVTFFSRLMLFMGIKHLGGIQTALLGLSELFISIVLSHLWLGEKLKLFQWLGAAFLLFSILLIAFEKIAPEKYRRSSGLLAWLRPPTIPPKIT